MDGKYVCICLCGLLCFSLLDADCPYKECQCFSTSISCMYLGLTALPVLNKTFTNFTSLSLDENHITTIPAGSLPSNLTDLSFIDNPLTTIDDTAFDGSKYTLQRLTLSNARLTRIPDAFSHLRNLQEFHIIGVPIADWNVEAMKTVGSTLQTLYIERVPFTSSPNWLQYFSCLTEIDILSSLLKEIPDNAMDLLTNTITYINVYNNSITEVPKAISHITSLLSLYLSDNKISNTTFLPPLSKLKLLSLDGNRIYNATQLSSSLRPYAESMMQFDISSNQLSSLPDLSFLTNVQGISFDDNKLSDSNSGAMPSNLYSLDLQNNFLPRIPGIMANLQSITDLSLPKNYITMIQGTDFPPKTTYVELGFNHITELTENSFPQHSVIEYLSLNNNPISKISPSAFINLQQLSELDLQSTHLTRMPVALSSLVNLFNLDFINIASLVCSCTERSLQDWVKARGPQVINGNCGQISIYEFFTILSPGCPTD
ncbi:hypothetical protein BsWGS_23843 [Bradybaena similaris]